MDDASPTHAGDAEQDLRELRQSLFSQHAVQRCHSILRNMCNKLDRSSVASYLETPSPAQQLSMGRNLRCFEHCQLAEPLPTLRDPRIDPSRNLLNMISRPSLRKLFAQLKESTQSSTQIAKVLVKNFAGSTPVLKEDHLIELDVTRLGLQKDDAAIVANYVRHLMERLPVLLQELSSYQLNWIMNAANRLAHKKYDNLKLVLRMPRYSVEMSHDGIDEYFAFHVSGYDHCEFDAWTEQIKIPVSGKIRPGIRIDVPNKDRTIWQGQSGVIPAYEKYVEDGFEQALHLAQGLAAYYSDFIGSFTDCHKDATLKYNELILEDLRALRAGKKLLPKSAPPNMGWSGESIWLLEKDQTYAVFCPSRWLFSRRQSPMSYLKVYTTEPERLFLIANGMLKAIINGCDANTAWGIGAALADEVNRCGKESAPILVGYADTLSSDEIHVCPDCLQLVAHRNMQASEFRYYSVCKDCIEGFNSLFKDVRINGGTVGHQLLDAFKRENTTSGGNETMTQLGEKTNDTISKLQSLFSSDGGVCHDGYVDCILNPRRIKPLTLGGVRLHPLVPSIDTIDPIVPGKDGLTHCHYSEGGTTNVMITADWVSRVKQHHPVVILHALLLFAEAPSRGQKTYEQAIAIMRNCLINHYEYGFIGNPQQSQRVGKPVPKNMEAITRSFRTAELLPRTKPNEMVWRMYDARPLGTPSQRASWRPPQFQWLQTQLRYIELEVFGERAGDYRKYWMRRGIDEKDVFWPFSQYSVSVDCTWWGLWEILAVRAERNVTVYKLPHNRGQQPNFYHLEEVFLVVANLWLRMVKKDIENELPKYDLGRDEAGLIPHPNINSLLCASLGHSKPGVVHQTGLQNFDLSRLEKISFVEADCDFMWQTQFTNSMKFKYHQGTYSDIFSYLAKIRRGKATQMMAQKELPTADLDLKLGDEHINLPPVTGKRIGRDSMNEIHPYAFDDILRCLAKKYKQGANVGRVPSTQPETGKDGSNLMFIAQTQIVRDEHDCDVDDNSFDLAASPSDPAVKASKKVDVAPCAQLSTLSATGYLSAIVHMLVNTPEIMSKIRQPPPFTVSTGRNPMFLLHRDADGVKHTDLIKAISVIANKLQTQQPSLPLINTLVILDASQRLDPQWENACNDAAKYFIFLMEAIDVLSDNSTPIMDSDIVVERADRGCYVRPAYRPDEVLDKYHIAHLTAGTPLKYLQDHADQHWEAHCQSGHQSDFARSTMVQTVRLLQCNSLQCPIVKREFQYSSLIQLKLPQDLDGDAPIALEQLIEQNFSADLDLAPFCPNRDLHKNIEDGRLTSVVSLIGRVGEVFTIHIVRTRKTPYSPKSSDDHTACEYLDEAGDNHVANRLAEFEIINLEKWANGRNITEKPHLGEGAPRTDGLDYPSILLSYQVCAIIAYSHSARHYTAFVKVEGRWTYFDDHEVYPVFRDPFNDWPKGFTETLLMYSTLASTNGDLFASAQSVVTSKRITTPSTPENFSMHTGEVISEPEMEKAFEPIPELPLAPDQSQEASSSEELPSDESIDRMIQVLSSPQWINSQPQHVLAHLASRCEQVAAFCREGSSGTVNPSVKPPSLDVVDQPDHDDTVFAPSTTKTIQKSVRFDLPTNEVAENEPMNVEGVQKDRDIAAKSRFRKVPVIGKLLHAMERSRSVKAGDEAAMESGRKPQN